MAVFHFELKSDMRKKDKKRTPAAKHVEYIFRKGTYKDVDERELRKLPTENRIWGKTNLEHPPDKEVLLYSSPFGVIKQSKNGISVSPHASVQTTAIALEVARRIYGNDLDIAGDSDFLKQSVQAICDMELDVNFSQEDMQKKLGNGRKERIDEQRRFIDAGGRYVVPSLTPGRIPSSFRGIDISGNDSEEQSGRTRLFIPDTQHDTIGKITQRGWSLPTLSGSNLVLSKRKSDMLLSADESRQLQRRIRRREHDAFRKLRWSVYGTRKHEVMRVADEIGRNMQKHLDKTFAASHVQYINRESVFEQRGGCIGKGHHLPTWAKDNPLAFFEAADKYERKGGERYKEIIFSLPHELTLDQQQEIIDSFIGKHMKNHYYAYAIHDKIGTMSNGERHTHVHLMFSTRAIDEVERTQERSPEQFFSRYNSQHPERGGAEKATCWYDKGRSKYLADLRESFAMIQNDILAKYNIPVRVDHRSLKARREEALANGDVFMAELLKRVPEKAVGPLALLEKGNKNVAAQKKLRQLNRQHEENTIAKNYLLDKVKQIKIQDRCNSLIESINEIKNILSPTEQENMEKELVDIDKRTREIETLLDATIWMPDATSSALLKFMPEESRILWQDLKKNTGEIKHWREFQDSLLPHEFPSPEAYSDVINAINRQIKSLKSQQAKLLPQIRGIFSSLKKNNKKSDIQKYAAKLSFDNRFIKEKLQTLLDQQEKAINHLVVTHKKQAGTSAARQTYTATETAREIYALLKSLFNQEHAVRDELQQVKKKYISMERAAAMAQNVFVKGEFKKLREAERLYRKNAPKMNANDRHAKEVELINWRANLEARCNKPSAIAKIQEITAGILRKNAPIAIRYQNLTTEHKKLTTQITEAKSALDASRHQSYIDRDSVNYRTIPAASSSHPRESPPVIIGKALSGNNECAALVARSKKDYPDEWELLSESERDELKNDLSKMM